MSAANRRMMLILHQQRQFSGYYRTVSGGNISEKLQEHQKKFEADPNSIDNAFHYFRVTTKHL
jgi:hypothetical protein